MIFRQQINAKFGYIGKDPLQLTEAAESLCTLLQDGTGQMVFGKKFVPCESRNAFRMGKELRILCLCQYFIFFFFLRQDAAKDIVFCLEKDALGIK